jgi:hypothetical protein
MDVNRNFDKNKILIGWWVVMDKICRWNWQRETAMQEVWQEVKGAVRGR